MSINLQSEEVQEHVGEFVQWLKDNDQIASFTTMAMRLRFENEELQKENQRLREMVSEGVETLKKVKPLVEAIRDYVKQMNKEE